MVQRHKVGKRAGDSVCGIPVQTLTELGLRNFDRDDAIEARVAGLVDLKVAYERFSLVYSIKKPIIPGSRGTRKERVPCGFLRK